MKTISLFSIASLIRGRKSHGVEDTSSYKHWRAKYNDSSSASIN